MDLETENRIAAMLMKEAAELRRQAEKDGVLAYLRQPQTRFKPNSRFLTATVLGVQQANRVVEVNEMWRVRQKEMELDDRFKRRSRDDHSKVRNLANRNTGGGKQAIISSGKRQLGDSHSRGDEGMRDEEMDEFLLSRVKRGRGAVGSRMDEPGPYLHADSEERGTATSGSIVREEGERRVLGPEKPPSLKCNYISEEELDHDRSRKTKKLYSKSSNRHHSSKHCSKERSREKKRKDKKKCKRRD